MHRYLLAGLLAACGNVSMDEPLRIVWNETYHLTGPAPRVAWIDGQPCPYHPEVPSVVTECTTEPSCVNGNACYTGFFLPELFRVVLVRFPSLHQSSFAHELEHAKLLGTTGDGDAGHTRLEWTTEVPEANKRLTDAGD